MSFFKTPLCWAAFCAVIFLSGLSYRGVFKKEYIPAPAALKDGGYHWFEAEVEGRIAKGWRIRTPEASFYLIAPEAELTPRSRLKFWGRFQAPYESSWSGLFDWKAYLAREGLSGSVYLDRSQDLAVLPPRWAPFALLHRLHETLLFRIKREFKDPRAAGLLSGLLLGDKRLLENSLKESFIKAGVMHLLVASGLHVALAFAFAFNLCLYVLRLRRSWAQYASLAAMWLFSIFIGLNSPVLRASVMVTALYFPLRRELPAISRLIACAFVFLIVKPSLIEDASFLLSFGSTFGILYGWMLWNQPKSTWIAAGWTSVFAWVILLPFSAGLFHQISLIAPISNLILIPFSGWLLACCAFYMAFSSLLPQFLLLNLRDLVEWMALLFVKIADIFAALPYSKLNSASWSLGWILAWVCLLAYPGLSRAGLRRWAMASLGIAFTAATAQAAWFFTKAPQAELFFKDERPALILASHRFERIFCSSEDRLPETIFQSRGWQSPANACGPAAAEARWPAFAQVLPRMPFESRAHLSLTVGSKTLIFPLTRLGGQVSYNLFP